MWQSGKQNDIMQGTGWLESTYLIYTANTSKKTWTLFGTRSWHILLKIPALSPSAQPTVPPNLRSQQTDFFNWIIPASLRQQMASFNWANSASCLDVAPFSHPQFSWWERRNGMTRHTLGKMVMRTEVPFYITNEHVPQMLSKNYISTHSNILEIWGRFVP